MKRALPLLLMALTVMSIGCNAPSADDLVERVLRQRRNYDARLSSWIVRDASSPPDLYLEVNVLNNNEDVTLRTLTVLVEQLDADGNELSSQRVTIDVAELTPRIGQSMGIVVAPAHPMVDGIRLHIERQPPREAWGEFPELAAVRPRI